jgi:hypothetical protein
MMVFEVDGGADESALIQAGQLEAGIPAVSDGQQPAEIHPVPLVAALHDQVLIRFRLISARKPFPGRLGEEAVFRHVRVRADFAEVPKEDRGFHVQPGDPGHAESSHLMIQIERSVAGTEQHEIELGLGFDQILGAQVRTGGQRKNWL